MLLQVKHLFSFVLLSLVPHVLADPKPSADALKFSALAASSPGGVIKLDSQSFDAITAAHRDWSVVVQLTAMGTEFKCAPCKQFDPNYHAVSKAWRKVSAKERDSHFFASLDFHDGRDIFMRLGLNSAPFVNFYPATVGPYAPSGNKEPWSYDFNSNAFDALTLSEQLSRSTPLPIPYKEPLNYTLVLSAGATFIFTLITARFFWVYFSGALTSRWTWGFITIVTSLVMCSGFMFVRIRGMPMAVNNKSGGASWIASGFQSQYGMETQVISILYGALAFSFIALILLVPKIPTAGRQRAGVYLWTTAMMVLYSLLITFFRIKNPGYPFGLIF